MKSRKTNAEEKNELTVALARKFFQYAGIDTADWFGDWTSITIHDAIPAYSVVNACKEKLVRLLTTEV